MSFFARRLKTLQKGNQLTRSKFPHGDAVNDAGVLARSIRLIADQNELAFSPVCLKGVHEFCGPMPAIEWGNPIVGRCPQLRLHPILALIEMVRKSMNEGWFTNGIMGR